MRTPLDTAARRRFSDRARVLAAEDAQFRAWGSFVLVNLDTGEAVRSWKEGDDPAWRAWPNPGNGRTHAKYMGRWDWEIERRERVRARSERERVSTDA